MTAAVSYDNSTSVDQWLTVHFPACIKYILMGGIVRANQEYWCRGKIRMGKSVVMEMSGNEMKMGMTSWECEGMQTLKVIPANL